MMTTYLQGMTRSIVSSARKFHPFAALSLSLLLLTAPAPAQSLFVNFEPKQTNPIRLSPDGSRLFAVNTPDGRLSVFDLSNPHSPILMAEIPVGVGPVSVNPIDNETAWVVNEVSDSVSVVSVSRGLTTDTISIKDEPADVVFARGKAFVSAARKNQIVVVDVASLTILTNIAVTGENPRALAARSDGARIYAAFALSGNRTTLVRPEDAPPQPPPTNPDLPAGPQVSLIVDAADPAWSTGPNPAIPYTMPDHDLVEIDTDTLAIVRYISRIGTVNLGLAVQPVSGDLWVANTDARNLVRFEPVLRGNFVSNRVSRVRLEDGSVSHFDLNPGFTYTGLPNLAELTNALAQPTAMAFGPSGNNFFVASFGTDRIARVNATDGSIVNRIELNPDSVGSAASPRTKRGPRGLALRGGTALYVLNRISNTLTIIDPKDNTIVREMPVGSHDPTPAPIRQGRGFLYDAKLSGAGTVSCASCHVDAEMDMIAWDLGDPDGEEVTVITRLPPLTIPLSSTFHPMKGPMTTQTLKGLRGLDPLHWRGDRTNFLHFNGAFDSLLGGSVLSDADMRAYRAYINTIEFSPNPNQNLDRSFPTAFPTKNGMGDAAAGRFTYINESYQLGLTCNTCHALPTGSSPLIIPALALQESQNFKVPHLRNVYQKLNVNFGNGDVSVGGFGLVHDGIDPDLFTFLSRSVFGQFSNDTVRKRNLDAFVQCFDTGTAPAVGHTRTLSPLNVSTIEAQAAWVLLENQARAANIDLIAKGVLDGITRGLLFDRNTGLYRADQTGLGPFTREQLETMVEEGDTLSLMGVPPGTGTRSGVDRNNNGILDSDEPQPSLSIALNGPEAVVAWSIDARGFVLETADRLDSRSWQIETNLHREADGMISVAVPARIASPRFYRLRGL